MASHNDLGKFGEELAVSHLAREGFKILHTNWVSGKAEIDIIAQKGKGLHIVEVKTRSSAIFGSPQNFVTPKKIKLLMSAVNEFVQSYDFDCEVHFDIVAITKTDTGYELERLPDAFYYF
ncbi:YraN family protein [Flavobacterium sp.]|uniref:YraN family protein n=1 Tax=Flavobacterium sp. TaxID=239 RepID=UPI001226B769|nr:YraN family protein [Flavobacterium sp.]RZJ73229.1 MAG: endonuclease [Flavobacterium sp.]